MYGELILGAEADVYGNVGARGLLSFAPKAEVHGDASYGLLSMGAEAGIDGIATAQGSDFWDALYSDIKSASNTAKAMAGMDAGAVTSTRTLERTDDVSVYNLSTIWLDGGSLTLKGGVDDVFIINVRDNFFLGGLAAILLDGVAAENVLFNMYGSIAQGTGHINVAAGTLQGTFIAPDANMQLGDGLTEFSNVRFLGAGMSANLQTLHGITPPDMTPPVITVSEPSMLLLIGLGLMGLGAIRRRTN